MTEGKREGPERSPIPAASAALGRSAAPMESAVLPPLRVVLDFGEETGADRRFEVVSALLEAGYAVSCSGTATALSPDDGARLLVLVEGRGAITEASADVSFGDGTRVPVRSIAGADAQAVVGLVGEVRESEGTRKPGQWKPWFPVIDYDRCTNCMQCLSFCLFDVYGLDEEKKIEVRNSDKCKTNCPACSRVCPEVAILFPKYGSGPINGDEINQEDLEREKMKTDISALLGGDIYAMLRQRHQRAASRFAKERDETRALKERLRCLKQLGEALDVPEEVLMALPSLEEIHSKAERAYEERTSKRGTAEEPPTQAP